MIPVFIGLSPLCCGGPYNITVIGYRTLPALDSNGLASVPAVNDVVWRSEEVKRHRLYFRAGYDSLVFLMMTFGPMALLT